MVLLHVFIQENMEEMPGAIILVGNKTDLPEEAGTSYQREVSRETGETFAKVQQLYNPLTHSSCCIVSVIVMLFPVMTLRYMEHSLLRPVPRQVTMLERLAS